MKVLQHNSSLSEATYPTFYPHITLASLPPLIGASLHDVDKAIRESILSRQRVRAPFRSVDIGDHYFRSVYIAIELTPELDTLRRQVYTALNLEKESPLFPHLSLCYISDDDAARGERKRLHGHLTSTGLKREFVRDSGISGVGLGVEAEIDGFDICEVWVVQCEGPVESWPVLRKITV